MKPLQFLLVSLLVLSSPASSQVLQKENNRALGELFDNYYEDFLKMYPFFQATSIGDNRYNHLLPIEFTNTYRDTLKTFFERYLSDLKKYNREHLSPSDKISYDILTYQINIQLDGLRQKDNLMPSRQFWSLPLLMAQFGSGTVVQPFKTFKDYNDWISRASRFAVWTDSAIVYFRKGMAENIVLPKALVEKMIPQMESFVTSDPTKSVYYGPITKLPQDFSEEQKKQLTEAFTTLINETIVPSYKKLADFLRNEYLQSARSSSGIGALPDGDAMYAYFIHYWTTTEKSPDELYRTGLSEVKRIQQEMEKVKTEVGFNGDLKAFFEYMRTDSKFYPYQSAEEILNAYRAVQQTIDPNLKKMFHKVPKTPFEIRQTEAFRAASAAAEYVPGLTDGSRPGIFYVPIVDAKNTSVRECLFLHEAIPGHHYQIMLQRENESLPKFRRFGQYAAYVEGWGLYAESLGKELGAYTDPIQYMRTLGDEIHRAIRLVVDVGLHSKGWTREKAIQYILDNEPIDEKYAVSEIERYMAVPGQALAYKVGELKIKELRHRYEKQLGKAFNLTAFHDEILKDGSMPLDVLERKMDTWAKKQSGKKSQ